jgi:SAM-dependent methyltransferase
LDLGSHPVAHHFLNDRNAPGEFRHPVALHFCEGCGLLQITDPIPQEVLYKDYICLSEWKATPHIGQLWDRIMQLPLDCESDLVVEAGCNDGSFLRGLRERGYRRLVGVEPAGDVERLARESGLTTIHDFFSTAIADSIVSRWGKCKLFVARHVLEHVQSLVEFLNAMQCFMAPGGYVLIEVPDFDFCLDWLDYGGIWEEHVNYFTAGSLSCLLESYGIRIERIEKVKFSGQAVILWGRFEETPIANGKEFLDDLTMRARRFHESWFRFREMLNQELERLRRRAGPLAVYGAGCRTCSLINFAGIGRYFELAIDDQPEKQQLFLPGNRLEIQPNRALLEEGIRFCLLGVNAENEERVIARNEAFLKAGGQFASLHPPSPRLIECWRQMAGVSLD